MSLSRRPRRLVLLVLLLVVVVAVPTVLLQLREQAASDAESMPSVAAAAAAEVNLDELGELDVVFTANDDGRYKLFAFDSKNPTASRVQVTAADAQFPMWTRSGEGFAFVTTVDQAGEKRSSIQVWTPSEGTKVATAGPQLPSHLSFRGESEIVYQLTSRVTAGSAGMAVSATIDAVKLANRQHRLLLGGDGNVYHPAVSPDGRQLAYVRTDPACTAESVDDSPKCPQSILLREEGQDSDTVLVREGIAADPSWSPDGARIAFTWQRDLFTELWVIDADGANARQVTSGFDDVDPEWSPDGTQLIFSRDCDLYRVHIGSSQVDAENLTRTPDVCEVSAAWRPNVPGSAR